MKNIFKLLFFLVLLGGCHDMLDQQDPTGPTGDDFYQTATDLEQAVVAAYAGLTLDGSFARSGAVGFEQLTDNVYHGSTTIDGSHGTWTTFNYDPTNDNINNVYTTFYQAINLANQVIAGAPQVNVSEAVKTQAIAEATFIRAYAHFILTLIWGDVPIVTEIPDDPAGFGVSPSPANVVYQQVIDDFAFAENNSSPTPSQGGRVSSWAAKAMLAQVYLFGADELNEISWYALSQQKAEEVINSGVYDLFDELATPQENLESIFLTQNENKVEHIFTINHFNSGGNWSDGNVAAGFPMAMNPRFQRNRNNMWGFGWAYVYEAIGNIWDDNDARKDYNLWMQGEPVIVNGVVTANYDQSNQNRCCFRANGMGLQKYWYQEKTKNVNGASTLGFPALRYAELLLIHTEADLLADGNLSAAGVSSINKVRNRAGLPDLSAAEITIEKILEERRWELFAEFKRWFDFMRKRNSLPNYIRDSFQAIVDGDTDGDDNDFSAFTPARHWKLPYPQNAVNRNPSLTQKPEWSAVQ